MIKLGNFNYKNLVYKNNKNKKSKKIDSYCYSNHKLEYKTSKIVKWITDDTVENY